MTTTDTQYLNFLHNKASEIRGKIIDHAISAEMILSDTLSHYFCTDEKKSLCYSIVFNTSDLTFSSKTKILEVILNTVEPELKLKFPNLIKTLDSVRKTRNRIAHSSLDTTESFISKKFTDRIQLQFYGEGEMKQMVVTDVEFRDKMKKSTLAIMELISLRQLIIERNLL